MSTVLSFLTPPPGFEPSVDFDLSEVAGAAGLYSLQSTGPDARRLFVLDAGVYLPDYSPVITDEQSTELALITSDNARVLVVANPADDGMTVNLMAPIVINLLTNRCAQVILDGQNWPLRAALVAPAA